MVGFVVPLQQWAIAPGEYILKGIPPFINTTPYRFAGKVLLFKQAFDMLPLANFRILLLVALAVFVTGLMAIIVFDFSSGHLPMLCLICTLL